MWRKSGFHFVRALFPYSIAIAQLFSCLTQSATSPAHLNQHFRLPCTAIQCASGLLIQLTRLIFRSLERLVLPLEDQEGCDELRLRRFFGKPELEIIYGKQMFWCVLGQTCVELAAAHIHFCNQKLVDCMLIRRAGVWTVRPLLGWRYVVLVLSIILWAIRDQSNLNDFYRQDGFYVDFTCPKINVMADKSELKAE